MTGYLTIVNWWYIIEFIKGDVNDDSILQT